MNPSQQKTKDMQDKARRQQQSDERIHELEEKIERLRYQLKSIVKYVDTELEKESPAWPALAGIVRGRAKRALDGGGGDA